MSAFRVIVVFVEAHPKLAFLALNNAIPQSDGFVPCGLELALLRVRAQPPRHGTTQHRLARLWIGEQDLKPSCLRMWIIRHRMFLVCFLWCLLTRWYILVENVVKRVFAVATCLHALSVRTDRIYQLAALKQIVTALEGHRRMVQWTVQLRRDIFHRIR